MCRDVELREPQRHLARHGHHFRRLDDTIQETRLDRVQCTTTLPIPSASNITDEADASVENAAGIVEVEPSQDLDAVMREALERYEAG